MTTAVPGLVKIGKTATRNYSQLDSEGHLLDDFSLGECSPSFAGNVVMNQSCDGWTEWKNVSGEPIDIYRKNMPSDD